MNEVHVYQLVVVDLVIGKVTYLYLNILTCHMIKVCVCQDVRDSLLTNYDCLYILLYTKEQHLIQLFCAYLINVMRVHLFVMQVEIIKCTKVTASIM